MDNTRSVHRCTMPERGMINTEPYIKEAAWRRYPHCQLLCRTGLHQLSRKRTVLEHLEQRQRRNVHGLRGVHHRRIRGRAALAMEQVLQLLHRGCLTGTGGGGISDADCPLPNENEGPPSEDDGRAQVQSVGALWKTERDQSSVTEKDVPGSAASPRRRAAR